MTRILRMSRLRSRRRVLVVYAHPYADSLIGAAHLALVEGLTAAGHSLRITDLYALNFDPVMSATERRDHRLPEIPPPLVTHAEDLKWCNTLVLVYPTWWSAQPAILKGWIDRVWTSGVAWELPEGANRLRPLLTNITRLVVVTSHGSPKWTNALQGEAGKRTALRSIRVLCHWRCRTSWWAIYGVDSASSTKTAKFVSSIRRRAKRL
jgi:NAD(P)H dehydrogenase (quinone)